MKGTVIMMAGFICGILCYEIFKHWRQDRKLKNLSANIDRDIRKLEETDEELHE